MTAVSDTSPTLDLATFNAIAELAYAESGLTLVEEKSQMIQSRLRHRLRALGLQNFAEYSNFVASDKGRAERRQLISALTTNVSHFFRENHHFDAMRDAVKSALPALRAGGRMRIWSAGCSNGQEPLSAAIDLMEHFPQIRKCDLRILATDIDPNVIQFARSGTYPEQLIAGLSTKLREKYFIPNGQTGAKASYTAHPDLRAMITFNELNLLADWPMRQPMDIVFCRNVVIYFDMKTQEALWPRFRQILRPGGLFFLGHSERISDPGAHGFSAIGPTAYRVQ